MIHRYKQCNLYFTLCLTLLCFSLLSCPIINGVFWHYLKYSNWREIIISVFMSRIEVLRTTWHCSKLADTFWHFLKGYWETQNNCSRPNLQLIEWNQNLKGFLIVFTLIIWSNRVKTYFWHQVDICIHAVMNMINTVKSHGSHEVKSFVNTWLFWIIKIEPLSGLEVLTFLPRRDMLFCLL